jgi:hypothetical protein
VRACSGRKPKGARGFLYEASQLPDRQGGREVRATVLAIIGLLISASVAAAQDTGANARIRSACAISDHEACEQQIHHEEMCIEYRSDAYNVFGYYRLRMSPQIAEDSLLQARIPALPDEEPRNFWVSEDELAALIHAAYSGRWQTASQFAAEAYRRCAASTQSISWDRDNSRCDAPPYGGSVTNYKAFVKNFGVLLDDPTKMLAQICRVKFEHADRSSVYNLGFTDQEIETKDTADLAIQMIEALKNLADKIPDK